MKAEEFRLRLAHPEAADDRAMRSEKRIEQGVGGSQADIDALRIHVRSVSVRQDVDSVAETQVAALRTASLEVDRRRSPQHHAGALAIISADDHSIDGAAHTTHRSINCIGLR